MRSRIYDSVYWKRNCFGLTAATLCDPTVDLLFIGGTYGGIGKPTEFLGLLLKMLQLQPETEIILEYLQNENFKYLRALAAMYWRMVGPAKDVFTHLEPYLNDYRKLRVRTDSGYTIIRMDEFIDSLLREDRVCDTILPRLTKRDLLEELGDLEPRVSLLDDELDEEEEDDMKEEVVDAHNGDGSVDVKLEPGSEVRVKVEGEDSSMHHQSPDEFNHSEPVSLTDQGIHPDRLPSVSISDVRLRSRDKERQDDEPALQKDVDLRGRGGVETSRDRDVRERDRNMDQERYRDRSRESDRYRHRRRENSRDREDNRVRFPRRDRERDRNRDRERGRDFNESPSKRDKLGYQDRPREERQRSPPAEDFPEDINVLPEEPKTKKKKYSKLDSLFKKRPQNNIDEGRSSKSSSGGGAAKEEMSIEQSNRIRASLGLKPLKM